jgi:hypothetical protein
VRDVMKKIIFIAIGLFVGITFLSGVLIFAYKMMGSG